MNAARKTSLCNTPPSPAAHPKPVALVAPALRCTETSGSSHAPLDICRHRDSVGYGMRVSGPVNGRLFYTRHKRRETMSSVLVSEG